MDQDIKELLSSYENLGNKAALRVGFMSVSQSDFDWEKFELKRMSKN